MFTVDTHVHFWQYEIDNPDFDWIDNSMLTIRKSFLPNDFFVDGRQDYHVIAVQAAQSWKETEFLLQLANENTQIVGVVGWVDLLNFNGESIKTQHPSLKGFRHIVQAESAGFMLQKKFIAGVNQIGMLGYTYDILIKYHQLYEAYKFVKLCPHQKLVIDHLAKPDIKNQEFIQWKKGIENFKNVENVYCKLSGMVTEANWHKWKPSDFSPYLDTVFEVFGTKRLMYGSDWPVCLLGGSYHKVQSILHAYISRLSDTEKESIWHLNAANFYNLNIKK